MSHHSLNYQNYLFPMVHSTMSSTNPDEIRRVIAILEHKRTEINLCLASLKTTLNEVEFAQKKGRDETTVQAEQMATKTSSSSDVRVVDGFQYQ